MSGSGGLQGSRNTEAEIDRTAAHGNAAPAPSATAEAEETSHPKARAHCPVPLVRGGTESSGGL